MKKFSIQSILMDIESCDLDKEWYVKSLDSLVNNIDIAKAYKDCKNKIKSL